MAGKADIVEAVADGAGLSKKQAADAVQSLIDSISGHLQNGDRVQLPGLGSFSVSHRAGRTGRNPKTGESIEISASNGVRFKVSHPLKDALN